MTPSGIEPATFRFVAQHLNHCATAALIGSVKKSPEAVGMASVKQVSLAIWKRDSFNFYL
jgi:hypothetical protein